MYSLLLAALFSSSVLAQNIHQSTCITPQKNPRAEVGAIYLHGWFSFGNDGSWYNNLESLNRERLQELANRTGYSIAVPVSEVRHSRVGKRTWTGVSLASIKSQSRHACPTIRMGQGLRILGFSDGGYKARSIALNCQAKAPEFSAVMMVGARASSEVSGRRENCAKFYAVRGIDDNSTNSCAAYAFNHLGKKVCTRSIPFSRAAKNMMNALREGGEVLPAYSGGHILPPTDLLVSALGGGQKSPGCRHPCSTRNSTAPSIW